MLPKLTETRNVYWDLYTQRVINGTNIGASVFRLDSDWMGDYLAVSGNFITNSSKDSKGTSNITIPGCGVPTIETTQSATEAVFPSLSEKEWYSVKASQPQQRETPTTKEFSI